VKNVGEPCAGEPHARFDAAAGGNQASRQARAAPAPPADPTATDRQSGRSVLVLCGHQRRYRGRARSEAAAVVSRARAEAARFSRPRRNDRNAASQLEPASRGNAGGMNLSPPFGRRRIGCVVGRKTSNCSRAFHRIQQRARVASRTVPLRWGKPASGAQQAGLSVLVSCGANCASLRVPQARVSGSRRRPSADARGSSQAGARASHTCARASSAHLRPAPIASRSSRVSTSWALRQSHIALRIGEPNQSRNGTIASASP
jgi:hypothetical protein